MSHITTQYETVSIDPSGSVSVRVSKIFVDDNEVEVATAREKQYFQRDATITDLPDHYQSAKRFLVRASCYRRTCRRVR